MPAVTFGMFDWIDRRAAPLHQIYEERLQLLEEADAGDLFCYHLAEHHATPLGTAPSPGVFLAAAAQRTRRIRLGPLVYLLPLYHPLRLIEEVCMLDHLSGGRLELGVGRGVSPYELGYHGVDVSLSREIFSEALAVLIAGLTSDRLNHVGEYYRFDDVPIEMQPLQRPYPPLWYATTNLESVPWAAAQGLNLVGLGPAAAVRPNVDLYRRTWQEFQTEPGRLNGHVTAPRVGINRQIVIADRDDEALAIARAAHERWTASFLALWHAHGDNRYDTFGNFDAALRAETIIAGSPDRVREQLARLIAVSGCDYVILAFAWGSMTHSQSLRSLRLFMREVAPAFASD
ncbi:MAG: LLM class flavin-dependent oxidoreductase [Dehalococcoidia bacterium]